MRSLHVKLIVAFLCVSLIGTSLVALYVASATTNRFGEFVLGQYHQRVADRWAWYYRLNKSWEGVAENVAMPSLYLDEGPPRAWPGPMHFAEPGNENNPDARQAVALVLADAQGRVIIAGLGYRPGERVPSDKLKAGTPIYVDEVLAGVLITDSRAPSGITSRNRFLEGFYSALLVSSISATLLALVLGALLARSLTRPLRELTAATHAVAEGDLEQQVVVRSRDELGELAASFNRMNAELARSRDLRRQMTADVAHDLRTPLSVVLGHAEALRDGVLPPTPETFHIMHEEAQRLQRLVEDLRTLSLAEAGELPMNRRLVSPQTLVEYAATVHAIRAQQSGISLEAKVAPSLPNVDVDPDRIAQVLDNLLDNALRYTPANGCVILSASGRAQMVRVCVQDNGPGIAPEELERVFDRFYRGDKSRQRDEGGSGLGLAIAKSIVEAHGGRIWAESELGAGVKFIVELPRAATAVAQ